MTIWDRTYDRLVGLDSRTSVGNAMRQRRWAQLAASFPDISQMRVIDLGGTATSWLQSPVRPAHVLLVNLHLEGRGDLPCWIDAIAGDACDISSRLRTHEFDLVYSNSVIEHVGGYARRREFALEVDRLAPAHWVQTPNRYFPIEPHWIFPGFQFFPVRMRRTLAMHWPLYKWRTDDPDRALREVLEIELLGRTEIEHLFPTSEVACERIMGLTKSFVVRRGHVGEGGFA